MGELVWLALGKGSCYLFWLIWGVSQAREGLAFFPAQKMPIYLINSSVYHTLDSMKIRVQVRKIMSTK